MPVVRPSVRSSVRPSVRPSVLPTCERDILRTVSPIDFNFEIYHTTENTDTIDFGTCAKTKMTAIELFKYVCYRHLL